MKIRIQIAAAVIAADQHNGLQNAAPLFPISKVYYEMPQFIVINLRLGGLNFSRFAI